MAQHSKTCLKRPLKKKIKNGFQDQLPLNASKKYCKMHQSEHFAILSTFIKPPFVIKIFVCLFLSAAYTGFTVCQSNVNFFGGLLAQSLKWTKLY